MNTAEFNAERIFHTELFHLGNETKRRLIELLASSLTFAPVDMEEKAKKDQLLDKICGAWRDYDSSAEEEIESLRKARTQGVTRKIIDL